MTEPTSTEPGQPGDRREFLKSAACAVFGTACILPPVVAGVTVLTAPIRELVPNGVKVKLSSLDALPPGPPRLFSVSVERTDAWTRHQRNAVGAVFLERTGERTVKALSASCPHLGGSIEYRPEQKDFYCPIHDSAFTAQGDVVQPSPAYRGLDTLDVEINAAGEIWVVFREFKAGIKEKIAVG